MPIKDPDKNREYQRKYQAERRSKDKGVQQPAQTVEPQQEPAPPGEGFYVVITGEKRKRGLIVHSVVRGREGHEDVRYVDVRGAFIPPRPKAPAVYLIAGEEWLDKRFDSADRGALVVLKEYIYPGLGTDRLYQQIMADATLFCFGTVYVDEEQILYEPFFNSFRKFKRLHNFRSVDFTPAPFANNVLAELALIADWRKRDLLEIDGSLTVFEQAKNVSREKLNDDGTLPEAEFFALECLGLLVGGFHVAPPPRPAVSYRPARTGGDAWMGD